LDRPRSGEPLCQVVLLGPVSESARDQLILGLQKRFRLTADQAERLLQRAPVVVKRGVTMEGAHVFVHHLEEIGARVRIERVLQEEPQTTTPEPETDREKTIPPGVAEPVSETYCLWEDMENLGFLRAFFGTIGEVLFHPTRFFSQMPVDRGLIQPLIFALVMGVLGGLIGLVYQLLMTHYIGGFFHAEGAGGVSVPLMVGSAIGLPILTVIGVFIGSAILHLCLMIVRGNRKGFEATFRVVAYAMSTQIFGIIPILGSIIGWIWTLVVEILGIRESHRISTGRAAFAIFLPLLAILALLIVLAVIMVPVLLQIFREVVRSM
jgi:hypothetical protein